MIGSAPLVVDLGERDRALWTMLLGCLATLVFGVWARLAPGFIASPPARPPLLVGGATLWLAGVVLFVLAAPLGPWLLLAGLAAVTIGTGAFGRSIARQPLLGHARLTRIGVRSAYLWAFGGVAIILAGQVGLATSYLQVSTARHALGLGFLTVMIYAVASRALPAFLGRRLWSFRLQVLTLALANLAVAARVGPQLLEAAGQPSDAIVGSSGILGYSALMLFALNVVRTMRGPSSAAVISGTAVPIELHIGPRA